MFARISEFFVLCIPFGGRDIIQKITALHIRTGKFVYGTDYRFYPPHQRTSKTKLLTYSSLAEAAHDFWVKRKCGKDYRIVVLEKVKVERTFDYYETKKFI